MWRLHSWRPGHQTGDIGVMAIHCWFQGPTEEKCYPVKGQYSSITHWWPLLSHVMNERPHLISFCKLFVLAFHWHFSLCNCDAGRVMAKCISKGRLCLNVLQQVFLFLDSLVGCAVHAMLVCNVHTTPPIPKLPHSHASITIIPSLPAPAIRRKLVLLFVFFCLFLRLV